MEQKPRKTKKQKELEIKRLKIAVACAVAVLFILGIIQIAQGFIDTHNYTDQITKAIQKETNREVSIKGNITVQLLPVPTLFIPSVELRDPVSDKPAPAVTIDLVSIQVTFMSIFSNSLTVSSISLNHPVLELVRAEDKQIYWDWMNAGLLKSLTENKVAAGGTLNVLINDGKILYSDSQTTEKATTIQNINTSIVYGKILNASGSFQIAGHNLVFTANTSPQSNASGKNSAPFQCKISSGSRDSLEVNGELDASGELPDIKGKFSLNLENILDWVQAVKPQEQNLFQQFTAQFRSRAENKLMLPVKVSSNWSQQGLTVSMDNVILEGLNSGAAGKINLSWTDWKPNVLMNLRFSGINYDQWSLLLTTAFSKNKANNVVYHEINEAKDNPIPDNINLIINLKADEVFFGQQIWKDAQMSANIGSGTVTVNQLNLNLQGDSLVSIFGVISPSSTSDLRFEGSMEASGKSLRQMLTIFDETATDLPETGFGDFFAHSNMFISSEQLRLSEADVKLGDLHLNGGLVSYFDNNPRVEADIKLKNINFDYFRDAWREKQKNSDKPEDFFLKFDKNMKFSWLKKLQTAIDFKIIVQQFTFLDRTGDNASFRLYAKNGTLGLYDINFIYPSDITKGSFKLDVNGEQPSMALSLNTDEVNTDYFNVEPYKSEPLESLTGDKLSEPPLDGKTQESVSASDTAAVTHKQPDQDASPPATRKESVSASDTAAVTHKQPDQKESIGPTGNAAVLHTLLNGDASPPATKQESVNASDTAAVTHKQPDQDASPPATKHELMDPTANRTDKAGAPSIEIKPQAETILLAENTTDNGDEIPEPSKTVNGLDELAKQLDRTNPHFAGENKKHWSEKLFDMGWLAGYSGEFTINVNRFVHKNIAVGNLKLKALIGNEQILFKTLSFSYWGGQCSIAGSLYGGKVPGFSLSFTLVDAQVQAVLNSFTERNNISGQLSVSATVTSSGVNMLSWISQADGKMVMIGRNIYVQGLNTQGVLDSIAISRTSSDVLNSVNRAIFNGYTIFTADGNLNIKNGTMRTPGIGLRTTSTIGNLQGELKLVPWTLELSGLFQFPTLPSETVPTMTIQYSGTPDAGELKTDTSSLESFVAKRIISQ